MRRLSAAAALAVPLLLLGPTGQLNANPPPHGFGCGGYCFSLFKGIHQHGPLFNYGPYYGYYPFTPYGPWDQYLRYDPYFYGQPGGGLGLGHKLHGKGCNSCGFAHASWLHGGWFKGHSGLSGNKHTSHGAPACSSCGGVATPAPAQPNGCATLTDSTPFGSPVKAAAAFYASTPTLNPVLDLPARK
jgi:hypothetical protein